MTQTMTTKLELQDILEQGDFEGILEMARRRSTIVRTLISLTYDKQRLVSWRAMEAIGRITAGWDTEKTRNLIQRMLWMMREESGTNPWSAGEIISEILRHNGKHFEDIIPIVISFHDEPILRIGSLWCIHRVGAVRPDLIGPWADVAREYLHSENPTERGHALLALSTIGAEKFRTDIEALSSDKAPFRYYNGEDMVDTTVGELAHGILD
jgi:hypothetical protein